MSKRFREVADGVLQVNLAQPEGVVTTEVHCFLIKSGEGYILIDSGWRTTARALVEAIQAEFGRKTNVGPLIITHLHPDHYGGAGAVMESFAPNVAYHRAESIIREKRRYLAWIDSLSVPPEVFEYVRSRADARISEMPDADGYLADGAAFESSSGRWRIVHTPGHTAGHICLFQKQNRILISGDHLLPNESSNVGSYPIRSYNPLMLYLANLTKVVSLRPSLVVPSHGEPFCDAKGRVAELFAHHKERLREVFDGLGAGNPTPTNVARIVRWSRGPFEDLKGFDKWLAISETISHLEFLCWCGAASRRSRPKMSYLLGRKGWSDVENAVDKLKL